MFKKTTHLSTHLFCSPDERQLIYFSFSWSVVVVFVVVVVVGDDGDAAAAAAIAAFEEGNVLW